MNTTRTLARQIVSILAGGTFLALIIAGSSIVHEADLVRAFIGADPATVAAQSGPTAADLVYANECWTGEAPADMAGQVPGHVVVTVDDQPRLGGARMVSKAFGQVFDGEDHGLTIHAFCR